MLIQEDRGSTSGILAGTGGEAGSILDLAFLKTILLEISEHEHKKFETILQVEALLLLLLPPPLLPRLPVALHLSHQRLQLAYLLGA